MTGDADDRAASGARPMTGEVRVEQADTITKLVERHSGAVVISGSHGGVYAGYCAARGGVRAVILNDAGVGKDRAGIGSLDYLDALGMPAATVDHASAGIANATEMAARGRISFVNARAAALGCTPGQTTAACAAMMARAAQWSADVPAYAEARFVILAANGGPEVVGCDSASLLDAGDDGCIVITGSHGGLLNGRPDGAIAPQLKAVTFCDAGGGRNGAGFARLPTLDTRGIAAATVAADSARIGDARSCYEDGRISHLNETAAAMGCTVGASVRQFVDRLRQTG